jgi:quinoprotein glucose dehydrogenase
MLRRGVFSILGLILGSSGRLQADPAVVISTNPPAAAAAAQARLRVAQGLHVDLWAAEPLVQDVTSFAFDEHGRAYVVESGRRRTSVFDVRNLQPWLDNDYALRSVDDRAEFLKQRLTPGAPEYDAFRQAVAKSKFGDFNRDGVVDWHDLEVEQERIRLVWDSDGDGLADTARTFADGFNGITSGVAAGVLARGSNVWFTCIPDVWRMPSAPLETSTNSQRGSMALSPAHAGVDRLLSGFGVHVAFGGHDLHGLLLGPDGRLYFSIADRGASVTTREGSVISEPDSGAIFRCEPDGSQMEVVATGLRNPQELAFDDWGNLWTGDNNGDGGDKARWTLVIEGANYGWSIGWQWLPKMGAWNSERLWHTREGNSAAWLMPPVAHIGHGPAGIAHYPGTGLGDRYRDHFFYADFPGGVRAFRVEPDGAFFRVVDAGRWMEDNAATNFVGKVLWNLAPVDLAFPPGGGLIVADAFPSWEKTGSARLWRVTDPGLIGDASISEVAGLLRDGMKGRSDRELVGLLAHVDQRVRLEAQWELAGRGSASMAALTLTALESTQRLARLHALWAVGQIGRKVEDAKPAGGASGDLATPAEASIHTRLLSFQPLLDDADPWVQEAVIRMFGETRMIRLSGAILDKSTHSNARVASAALRVAARLYRLARQGGNGSPAVQGWKSETLQQALLERHLDDPVVREAKVAALVDLADSHPSLFTALDQSTHTEANVLAVLARRRLGHASELRGSLSHSNPVVLLETARALHDVPTGNAWTHLSGWLRDTNFLSAPTETQWPAGLKFTREEWRTWVFRRAVNATFLLGSAATDSDTLALARFAVRADAPASVRVEALEALTDWARPVTRDRVLGVHRPRTAGDGSMARAAVQSVWPGLVSAAETNASVLVAALRAGEKLRPDGFAETLTRLANHAVAGVRAEAVRIVDQDHPRTTAAWVELLDSGSLNEQRAALARLATSKEPVAMDALVRWMTKLVENSVVDRDPLTAPEPGKHPGGGTPPSTAGETPAATDASFSRRGVARDLELDVLEAARQTGGERLRPLLAAWDKRLPQDDPLARFRVAMQGGDPANGRRLFAERADWGCQRCHKLRGEGGDVGPELTGIGRTRGAEHVLQSILNPNQEIAPGFENVVITLKNGETLAGMVKSETDTELVLDAGEDGRVTLPKSQVVTRQRGLSSMVEGLGEMMALRELRDLVAALME